jgi:3-oxoadipate CoA-transferase, alpha subunit
VEGKETREIDGRLHVFEKPLKGDIAPIKATPARTASRAS